MAQNYTANNSLPIFSTQMNVVCFLNVPNKTYHFKNEKCTGSKHSKVRLTGMAVANVNGERLPVFVIGKSKTPRCFKRCEKHSLSLSGITKKLDIIWIAHLIWSSPQLKIFSKLCKHFNKKKDKKKKRTRCFLIPQSL